MSMTETAQIEAGKIGIFHYTLRDTEGETLDSSREGDPMAYLHGSGNIVRGLEKEMLGRSIGDTFEAVVAPEEGYGALSEQEPWPVPRKEMPETVKSGMQFVMQGSQGQRRPVWVDRVEEENVFLTANHPLAGKTLHFDCEVINIRDATYDEKKHGHAHGLDGHATHGSSSPTGTRSLRRKGRSKNRKKKNKKK